MAATQNLGGNDMAVLLSGLVLNLFINQRPNKDLASSTLAGSHQRSTLQSHEDGHVIMMHTEGYWLHSKITYLFFLLSLILFHHLVIGPVYRSPPSIQAFKVASSNTNLPPVFLVWSLPLAYAFVNRCFLVPRYPHSLFDVRTVNTALLLKPLSQFSNPWFHSIQLSSDKIKWPSCQGEIRYRSLAWWME